MGVSADQFPITQQSIFNSILDFTFREGDA